MVLKREMLYKGYEIMMGLLALFVVVLMSLRLFFEYESSTAEVFLIAERGVLLLLALDYGVRLLRANDKKRFFRSNIWDLMALMPFSSAFRVFRWVRLFRTFAFLKRSLNSFQALIKTNYLHMVIAFTSLVVFLGALGMHRLEKGLTVETFGDSLWWSLVTITTVGYGDIAPVTTRGRFLAALLMFVGIGFISFLTGTIATFFVHKAKERAKVNDDKRKNELVEGAIERLGRFHELNLGEVEEICSVLLLLKSKDRDEEES